jgi:hypothetical protein
MNKSTVAIGGSGHLRFEDLAMREKKAADDDRKAATVVVNHDLTLKGVLKSLGGSQSDDWNNILANQAMQTLWLKHSDEDSRSRQYSATVAALVGIGPKDEIEGMIAAQLLAAHHAAMECYRRAMHGEQTFEGRQENLNQANKLSRTHAALVEALDRHRGKGQQKVTVEHVHVYSGAQAVVGPVETPGGGDRPKTEDQPHAIAYSPRTEMRCENPTREFVPIAGNAERSLPDARRKIDGRSEG